MTGFFSDEKYDVKMKTYDVELYHFHLKTLRNRI